MSSLKAITTLEIFKDVALSILNFLDVYSNKSLGSKSGVNKIDEVPLLKVFRNFNV